MGGGKNLFSFWPLFGSPCRRSVKRGAPLFSQWKVKVQPIEAILLCVISYIGPLYAARFANELRFERSFQHERNKSRVYRISQIVSLLPATLESFCKGSSCAQSCFLATSSPSGPMALSLKRCATAERSLLWRECRTNNMRTELWPSSRYHHPPRADTTPVLLLIRRYCNIPRDSPPTPACVNTVCPWNKIQTHQTRPSFRAASPWAHRKGTT